MTLDNNAVSCTLQHFKIDDRLCLEGEDSRLVECRGKKNYRTMLNMEYRSTRLIYNRAELAEFRAAVLCNPHPYVSGASRNYFSLS